MTDVNGSPVPPSYAPSSVSPVAPPVAPYVTPYGFGAPVAVNPGKTLGIVGFVLSFFISVAGIVIGIIALAQSKKAGYPNGFALAAIIIGSVALVGSIVSTIAVVVFFGGLTAQILDLCSGLPTGTPVEFLGEPVECP